MEVVSQSIRDKDSASTPLMTSRQKGKHSVPTSPKTSRVNGSVSTPSKTSQKGKHSSSTPDSSRTTADTRVKDSVSTSPKTSRQNGKHSASASDPLRTAADTESNGGKSLKFVKCKQIIQVSTFHVTTLDEPHSLKELVDSASKFNIDVICVQERSLIHESDYDIKTVSDEYTLITSSANRNSAGASESGVGFLMNKHASKCLKSITAVSERIILATFLGNPKTTVVSVYSPTSCSEEDEVVSFYKDLADAVSSIPKHNVLLICGDFDAKLGSDTTRFSFHDLTDRNGMHLENFANEFNLFVSNTSFRKRQGKLWTVQYPDSTKAQVDFILVRRMWRNSIHNAEAFGSFSSVRSNHRIVTARIQLSLHAPLSKFSTFIVDGGRSAKIHRNFLVGEGFKDYRPHEQSPIDGATAATCANVV